MQPKIIKRVDKTKVDKEFLKMDVFEFISARVSEMVQASSEKYVRIKSDLPQVVEKISEIRTDLINICGNLKARAISCVSFKSDVASIKEVKTSRISGNVTHDKIESESINSKYVSSIAINSRYIKSKNIGADGIDAETIVSASITTDNLHIGKTILTNDGESKVFCSSMIASTIDVLSANIRSIFRTSVHTIACGFMFVRRLKATLATITEAYITTIASKELYSGSVTAKEMFAENLSSLNFKADSTQTNSINGFNTDDLLSLVKILIDSKLLTINLEYLKQIEQSVKEHKHDDYVELNAKHQIIQGLLSIGSIESSSIKSSSLEASKANISFDTMAKLPMFDNIEDMSKRTKMNWWGNIGGDLYLNTGSDIVRKTGTQFTTKSCKVKLKKGEITAIDIPIMSKNVVVTLRDVGNNGRICNESEIYLNGNSLSIKAKESSSYYVSVLEV